MSDEEIRKWSEMTTNLFNELKDLRDKYIDQLPDEAPENPHPAERVFYTALVGLRAVLEMGYVVISDHISGPDKADAIATLFNTCVEYIQTIAHPLLDGEEVEYEEDPPPRPRSTDRIAPNLFVIDLKEIYSKVDAIYQKCKETK